MEHQKIKKRMWICPHTLFFQQLFLGSLFADNDANYDRRTYENDRTDNDADNETDVYAALVDYVNTCVAYVNTCIRFVFAEYA